jgi:hypothetical protein
MLPDILFAILQILILCLLAEVGKGKTSVWYPYLSQLPSYYTLLATFSDFEVEALQVQLGRSISILNKIKNPKLAIFFAPTCLH